MNYFVHIHFEFTIGGTVVIATFIGFDYAMLIIWITCSPHLSFNLDDSVARIAQSIYTLGRNECFAQQSWEIPWKEKQAFFSN